MDGVPESFVEEIDYGVDYGKKGNDAKDKIKPAGKRIENDGVGGDND